jgi:hypothetical protein
MREVPGREIRGSVEGVDVRKQVELVVHGVPVYTERTSRGGKYTFENVPQIDLDLSYDAGK